MTPRDRDSDLDEQDRLPARPVDHGRDARVLRIAVLRHLGRATYSAEIGVKSRSAQGLGTAMQQHDAMAAVLAAHATLNVDPGFIPRMTPPERARMVAIAGTTDTGLSGTMTFCSKLKKNAFACDELGEPKTDVINGRDLAAAVFQDTQIPSADRAKFCAWYLMQTPKNVNKLYLPTDAAHAELRGWDAEDAIPLLVPHPSRHAVTNRDLHAKQQAINRMWRDADAICPAPDAPLPGLDAAQQAAVAKVLATPASILRGMGGTGKSFVLSKMIGVLQREGVEVVCLAPTHKAKYNIAAAVPADVTVKTIQSYTQTLKRGTDRVSELVVIVDEASMLDVDSLGDFALALLERVDSWQICLVGDPAQLPPVGRGECFRMAVRQAKDVTVRLTHCYRAAFVKMFDFHCELRIGRLPDGDGEVAAVKVLADDRAVMREVGAVVQREGASMVYIAWRNADVDAINKMVQLKATGCPPAGTGYNVDDAVVYVGDNKPSEQLTNAMCGRVVSSHKWTVTVAWDVGSDKPPRVSSTDARNVRLAYCLTVHKAQGSGFARVCVAVMGSSTMLMCLDRRWLYTAVSRAQREVLVVCTRDAHALAANEPQPAQLSCLSFRPA